MIPYLVAFAISIIFVSFASKTHLESIDEKVLLLMAVLPLAFLAGIRDYEVGGPDSLIYGNRVFQAAVNSDSWTAFYNGFRDEIEIGYLAFNYLISKFTSDQHVFYFWLSLFTNGIAIRAVGLFRQRAPMVTMWAVYLLTIYVQTFNLLRQSIALSLGLLVFAYVMTGKTKKSVIIALGAIIFHTSAVILLPLVIVLHAFMSSEKTLEIAVVLFACAFGARILASTVTIWLSAAFGGTKYESYLLNGATSGQAVGLETLYRIIPILTLFSVILHSRNHSMIAISHSKPNGVFKQTNQHTRSQQYRSLNCSHIYKNNQHGKQSVLYSNAIATAESTAKRDFDKAVIICVVVLTVELILLPIREISYPFYRIVLYLGYIRVFAYSLVVQAFKGTTRVAVNFAVIVFAFLYFLAMYIWNGTGLFSSQLLGF